MNIQQTIDLYFGGDGSGCDPETAAANGTKCGRPKGSKSIGDAVDDFVQEWTFGKIGKSNTVIPDKPSADVLREMKKFQTDEPMILYRSHIAGTPSNDMESWTTSKEMARSLTEDFGETNRVTLTRRVDPSEVIFWGKKYNDLVGDKSDLSAIEEEVLVANGKYAQTVAKARGQSLVRGQQWNPKRNR